MGIALFAASALTRPLTVLHRWWGRRDATCPQHSNARAEASAQAAITARPQNLSPQALRPAPVPRTCASPVAARPVRTPEPGHKPASRPPCTLPAASGAIRVLRGHGRMVIAGRMADVCAELDRLAACELQH